MCSRVRGPGPHAAKVPECTRLAAGPSGPSHQPQGTARVCQRKVIQQANLQGDKMSVICGKKAFSSDFVSKMKLKVTLNI